MTTKICPVCGDSFSVRYRRTTFCSRTCSNKSRRNTEQGQCKSCGKFFALYKNGTSKGKRKSYCSDECRLAKAPRVSLVCHECGRDYSLLASYLKIRSSRFCSKECRDTNNSHEKMGYKNHNYRGGTIQYRGQNWGKQSRLARKRDGYKCQICNKKIGRKRHDHGVHHIKPYREFNGDWQTANQLSNLVTLCSSCHTRVECGSLPCPVHLL